MAAVALRSAPALLKASSKVPISTSAKQSMQQGKMKSLNPQSMKSFLQTNNKSKKPFVDKIKNKLKTIDKSKIANLLSNTTLSNNTAKDIQKQDDFNNRENFIGQNNMFKKEKKILEVNKMIKTLLGGVFTVVPMLTYLIVLLILVFSLLNIIIFPIAIISDWTSDDILIKDTFKYKLLEYSSKHSNESYFFISYIKYAIFFMIACYIAIIVIFMFIFILWLIATLFTLTSSAFQLDAADYKASDYINLPVIMGVVVSFSVYGFYLLFF
jgi:hypothetical protein